MAQVSAQKCLLCDESNAAYYCFECQNALCTDCRNKHGEKKVKEHIQELTLNINKISSLHEQVKTNHQNQQLHAKSTQCIENIESVCKDLQSFIESKRGIKVSEVDDNKRNEEDKLEASFKNMDSVQKRYTHILSELEKLLFEKHDVTFHSCYISMQSDIQTLENMPEEPPLAQEPNFQDKILYKEIMKYMDSKIDKSLCKNCPIQRTRIDDLQSKYKTSEESFKRDLEKKNGELKSKTKELQMLKRENDELFQFKCSQPNYCHRCGQYIPSTPFYQHACKGRIT
ncbi:unnamed protein product [Mytilus edulis]|uniref:B box-type domain-containing protein n=1 Tax=Mytilus edulis TaxID=6550 RepID=A0A8S3UCD1_MYTED|nr:unnamed protein product [Mytilus edulis]